MTLRSAKLKSVLIHLLSWLIWIFATLAVSSMMSRPASKPMHLANFMVSICLFYVFYHLIYKKFRSKSYKVLFAVPLAVVLFPPFHALRIWLVTQLMSQADVTLSQINYFNRDAIAISLAYFFQYAMFSFGYFIAISALDRQKRIAVLEQENHYLEKHQLITEINFLKAQINPHFLYNTLNTLYAQAQPHSEELAQNIVKLSEIMRYSLESVDNEKGTVQLRKELDHMKNLIDIHQLRFSNSLHIDYQVNGIVNGQQVPPLSMITAVENAFKYGDLKNPEHPVKIRIDIEPNHIHFTCCNKKKKGSIETTYGIGINNIKRRLNIAFKNRYELKTQNDGDNYTFELTLNN